MNSENASTDEKKIEKILTCYICKKAIETEKANFDLINRVAVHLPGKKGFSNKIKNAFSKNREPDFECTTKYIKEISRTGREIQFKEVKIDDIFRHHKELFIIINEQEELPDPSKSGKLPVL